MYTNGVNNNGGFKWFKVDTVDPQSGQAGTDAGVQGMNDSLDGFFNNTGTTGTTDSGDKWIITDPTATSTEDNTLSALSDYPPALDDILIANPSAAQYLDMIKARYETTKEGLITLRDNYTAAMPNVSVAEAALLQKKIDRVNAAIFKTDQQIQKSTEKMGNDSKIYDQEKAIGKDLNGDGWIGRPGASDSLRVVYDKKNMPHYLDKDGNEIANPATDPNYNAKVITDNGMKQIDASTALGADQDAQQADIYFQANQLEAGHDYGTDFNTPINIGIPETLWVKKADGEWSPDEDTESDSNDAKLVFDPDLWVDGVQQTPAEAGKNNSDYVQVRVASVEVGSEEVHGITTVDGKPLYNTFVKFKDSEDRVIATIRIEGYASPTDIGAATQTTDGTYYVAASTLGIRFFGSDRVSVLKFDASGYESTGRHIVNDFANALGIDAKKGTPAYDENAAAFEGESFATSYWKVTGANGTDEPSGTDAADIAKNTGHWETVSHDYSASGTGQKYGDLNDVYMTDDPGDTDMLQTLKTGVFVDGLRGSFTGSNFNDIFKVADVNELSDYAKAHQPPGAEKIHTGNPLYSSYVDGRGGANALVAGTGDLFAEGINFASVDAGMDDDIAIVENYDAFNTHKNDGSGLDDSSTLVDPKIFVRVKNAKTATLFQDQSENRSSKWDPGFFDGYNGDDYYEGLTSASKPNDSDMAPGSSLQTADSFAGQSDAYTQIQTDLEAAINTNGVETDSTFDAKTEWENEHGKYGDTTTASQEEADMDAFFSSMFGDLNEFKVEMDQMT